MRKGQGQLDLVGDGLSVTTALNGSTEERRASPEGGAGETKRAHFAVVVDVQGWVIPLEVALQRSKSERRLFPSGLSRGTGIQRPDYG